MDHRVHGNIITASPKTLSTSSAVPWTSRPHAIPRTGEVPRAQLSRELEFRGRQRCLAPLGFVPRHGRDRATSDEQTVGDGVTSTAPEPKKKRFACPPCTRTFARNGHLQRHGRSQVKSVGEFGLMVDTNERPFQCPQCSSAFGTIRYASTKWEDVTWFSFHCCFE